MGEINSDGSDIFKSHVVGDTTAVMKNQGMKESGTENEKNECGAYLGSTKKTDGPNELAYLDHHQAEHVGVGITADVSGEGWCRGQNGQRGLEVIFSLSMKWNRKCSKPYQLNREVFDEVVMIHGGRRARQKNTVITSEDKYGKRKLNEPYSKGDEAMKKTCLKGRRPVKQKGVVSKSDKNGSGLAAGLNINPVNCNESFKLELPRAWEPSDSSGTSLLGEGKETQHNFLNGN
jgi:hypothetical protein